MSSPLYYKPYPQINTQHQLIRLYRKQQHLQKIIKIDNQLQEVKRQTNLIKLKKRTLKNQLIAKEKLKQSQLDKKKFLQKKMRQKDIQKKLILQQRQYLKKLDLQKQQINGLTKRRQNYQLALNKKAQKSTNQQIKKHSSLYPYSSSLDTQNFIKLHQDKIKKSSNPFPLSSIKMNQTRYYSPIKEEIAKSLSKKQFSLIKSKPYQKPEIINKTVYFDKDSIDGNSKSLKESRCLFQQADNHSKQIEIDKCWMGNRSRRRLQNLKRYTEEQMKNSIRGDSVIY